MYLKVVLPEEAKKNIEESYINSDKIIEVFYNTTEKTYLATVEMPYVKDGVVLRGTSVYAIEEDSFNELVGKPMMLCESKTKKKKK